MGDLGSIPGLGKCPGKGKSYSLQYSGLENSSWRYKESGKTEGLSLHFNNLVKSTVLVLASKMMVRMIAVQNRNQLEGLQSYFIQILLLMSSLDFLGSQSYFM